jgi:hypothetical protein
MSEESILELIKNVATIELIETQPDAIPIVQPDAIPIVQPEVPTKLGKCNAGIHGSTFEKKTNSSLILCKHKFKLNSIGKIQYLSGILNKHNVIFIKGKHFISYIKNIYHIETLRYPDEAYIINLGDITYIKILEKKAQHVSGSNETKLWAGPSLKREFEIIFGNKFKITYGFCLNEYFKNKFATEKKFTILNQILKEDNISIMFGDDSDYFEKLLEWITIL